MITIYIFLFLLSSAERFGYLVGDDYSAQDLSRKTRWDHYL